MIRINPNTHNKAVKSQILKEVEEWLDGTMLKPQTANETIEINVHGNSSTYCLSAEITQGIRKRIS